MSCELGVYGLAVMGVNLALNAASKGFRVCVGNRTPAKVDTALELAKEQGLEEKIFGAKDMKVFVESIERPRRIIMLVQAGAPVDALISALLPLLSRGDILVDGGNEFYKNTEHRLHRCNEHGVYYLGMGVSGGEEGARHGPSLMPGGNEEAWESLKPILLSIAAQIDKTKAPKKHQITDFTTEQTLNACVAYLGPGGCGNFVKMVHNGIEYGDMEIIAEVYSLLRHCYNMSNEAMADLFTEWNKTELNSYLIEITSHIFRKKEGNGYLLDEIIDAAGSKGTGAWTVQQAAEWGVPVPCLAAALDMRYISAHRGLRERLSNLYSAAMQKTAANKADDKPTLEDLRRAMYAAKICCYAQGMQLIEKASKEKAWGLNLAEVSRIWKGGCIIRAGFLEVMEAAFKEHPNTNNLLLVDRIRTQVLECLPSLRKVVSWGIANGAACANSEDNVYISLPSLSAAYNYISALTSERLPTSLTQAQRDFFGAHGFYKKSNPHELFHEREWIAKHK